MPAPKGKYPAPVIRVAPLGELKVYEVAESELDQLAQGSPSALWLNFALALLPCAAGIVVTMISSNLSDLNFTLLTSVSLILVIAGVICLAFWLRTHEAPKDLLRQIKNRMPPPP